MARNVVKNDWICDVHRYNEIKLNNERDFSPPQLLFPVCLFPCHGNKNNTNFLLFAVLCLIRIVSRLTIDYSGMSPCISVYEALLYTEANPFHSWISFKFLFAYNFTFWFICSLCCSVVPIDCVDRMQFWAHIRENTPTSSRLNSKMNNVWYYM